jgi:hypothetical protein
MNLGNLEVQRRAQTATCDSKISSYMVFIQSNPSKNCTLGAMPNFSVNAENAGNRLLKLVHCVSSFCTMNSGETALYEAILFLSISLMIHFFCSSLMTL